MAGRNLALKILEAHLAGGNLAVSETCEFRVDSTLVHDMSGLLAFMGFDAMKLARANVSLPIIFNDHNLLAMSTSTSDDQAFLKSCAQRFGLCYSLPGNGICHSLYLNRFGSPGWLLVGADSHTATAGALGMIGIGLGGMDVAVIMSGEPLKQAVPAIVGVRLSGRLAPGVSAKDVALTLLKKMGVRGGVGKIFEYTGLGLANLTVLQRATLCNMGAEMGATSSLFSADERVREFLAAQGREGDFIPLAADEDAVYDKVVELDLSVVEPMVALPDQPDRGCLVQELGLVKFDQIFIGSCTNGSYVDLARAALIMKGRHVAGGVPVLVSCTNRQIFSMLLRDGYVQMFVDAGARVLEPSCGPCMGIGQAPPSGATILRTTNRNYPGRSGTADAQMYLCGTETAAATAVMGHLACAADVLDPALLDAVAEPKHYPIDDVGLIRYDRLPEAVELRYGANIRPVPVCAPLGDDITAAVSLKLGDGVSTDDIVPPDPVVLALRPNIPKLSEYIFHLIDPNFAARAAQMGESVIVAGDNYAQGSSREHAAIGCMQLGVRAVLVKSIHRIHRGNLINYGVLPLIFEDSADYDAVTPGDKLKIAGVAAQIRASHRVEVENVTRGTKFFAKAELSDDELAVLSIGGLLPYIASRRKGAVA